MIRIKLYPPRAGDLSREELMAAADRAVEQTPPGSKIDIHFKFTCEHCGERCILSEPNRLYENGICCRCGKETVIEFGGFSIITTTKV